MVEKREGFKFVKSFDNDEPIVAMVEHVGLLFIATTKRVFVHKDGKLEPIEMVIKE